MSLSLQEQLTDQFYEWESRGRGREVFAQPVDLEPPFIPFYALKVQVPFVDDGKQQTVFNYFANLIRKLFDTTQERIETPTFDQEIFPFKSSFPINLIELSFPRSEKYKVQEFEQLFVMLSFSKCPISFEIIANSEKIKFQIACRECDISFIKGQIKAYFPRCVLICHHTDLEDLLISESHLYGLDFGLHEEFMRPIKTVSGFDLDPYTGLFGVLEQMDENVQIVIQVLFKGVVNSWAESILQSVSDSNGDSFFIDAPEMLPLAREKISSPLFGVVVRIAASGPSPEQSKQIVDTVGLALSQLSSSSANKLVPLSNEGYETEHFFKDFELRQSHRLGMLLNGKELATLVHFPSPNVTSLKFQRNRRKTKKAPSITVGYDLILGNNLHDGESLNVTLPSHQRLKHTHIIGATGSGKSTLLLNLIVQDIEAVRGVAILDPHGDLIEDILMRIPEHRIKDVVLIDPSDSQFPVGLNLLSASSEIEKDILSSDLISVFRRLSTSWGDQMNSVFANAIQAFVDSNEGGTLFDLRRFLIEKEFRESFLKTVTDPSIVYYWKKEYPILKTSSIGPILTRLDTFLRPKLIRNMVIQKHGVNFNEALNSQKILLVKLSQGMIGSENSYLLGTMIVSKLHQAAIARQEIDKNERNDFYFYIDEFQHFITPSMASILSGARKYHMGLILAHQDMQQVISIDPGVAASVLANAGTRVCFRLGEPDAKKFESGFSYFVSLDFQNLGTGEAIVKIERPEFDFSLSTVQLTEVDKSQASITRNQIISHSRNSYGTSREEVESSLSELWGSLTSGEKASNEIVSPKVETKYKRQDITPLESPSEPIRQNIDAHVESEDNPLLPKAELTKHRYLQALIKKMAESRGYKAVVEEPTPDGKGRVDVALSRNEFRIACEISVTTSDLWEIHNIEKCLTAGYDLVIVCSSEKRVLDKILKRVKESFDEAIQLRVLTLTPEKLFLYLDQQIANDMQSEERVKGYRVKVKYTAVSDGESKAKKDGVLRTLTESSQRSRK